MAWMKHIDQVINDTYARRTPPADAMLMAEELRQEGYPDVASYVGRLEDVAYDDVKWRIELRQMNSEDPSSKEDQLTDVELDQMFESQEAYPYHNYEEAYGCK